MKSAPSTFSSFKIPKNQPIVEQQNVTQEVKILESRQPQKVTQEVTIVEPRQPKRQKAKTVELRQPRKVNQEAKIDFSASRKQKLLGNETEKVTKKDN